MVPCRECQHEVSEYAPVCPNCGAPNPAKGGWIARSLGSKRDRFLRQTVKHDIQERDVEGVLVPCRECQQEVSRDALICMHCGAPRPTKEKWDGWGYEYKSKTAIAGLPLIHISFKYRPNYMPVVARGFIAIGQFGAGVITIAQVGIGIVSVSQLAVGVWAIGQLAFAFKLIAQLGIYVQSGYGQAVKSLAEVIQWLTAGT